VGFAAWGLTVATFIGLKLKVVKWRIGSDGGLTLHFAIKPTAPAISTPDQSLSISLIAKAQYSVRRSDSTLPGTVEKLWMASGCRYR
jgi:hypothetical protein